MIKLMPPLLRSVGYPSETTSQLCCVQNPTNSLHSKQVNKYDIINYSVGLTKSFNCFCLFGSMNVPKLIVQLEFLYYLETPIKILLT